MSLADDLVTAADVLDTVDRRVPDLAVPAGHFGADEGGMPGRVGRQLHAHWEAALSARAREAAEVAARVLDEGGFALTLQNGIGNVETLAEVLGPGRVVGGSTMCSFRVEGPGRVRQTHAALTTVGELDGRRSERVEAAAAALRRAGYEVAVTGDIRATIWTKLLVNLAINPVCAITGLRLGEFARLEATDRFQDRLLDEAFAVVRAKGLGLDEAAIRATIKAHCWGKYSEPSMLQHVNAGRRTEIDALSGTMNREAAALGVPAYSILACEVGAVDRQLEKSGQLTFVTSPKDFMQKIRLVRRPRPLAAPNYPTGALEAIMGHLEEILSVEYAKKSVRKPVPVAQPSRVTAA